MSSTMAADQDLYVVVRLPDGRSYHAVLDGRKERYLIGRYDALSRTAADILLDDRTVSRKHCELVKTPSRHQWIVRDLHSSNGTQIDGSRIDPERAADLRHGDHLQLGDTAITLGFGTLPPGSADTPRTNGGMVASRPGTNGTAANPSPQTRMVLPRRPEPPEIVTQALMTQAVAPPVRVTPVAGPASAIETAAPSRLLLVAAGRNVTGSEPAELAGVDQFFLYDGDEVSVSVRNGRFAVRPSRAVGSALDELVIRITPENRRPETPWVSGSET